MPSSVIREFDYDDEQRLLTVAFVTGRVYEYYDVPPDVVAALRIAPSRGSYFNAEIRDRFSFREIMPGRPKPKTARKSADIIPFPRR